MIRPKDHVFQEAPGLEQRLSELQAQIDRLTVSLQLWRDGQERIAPADERLARLADEAGDLLHEWSLIGERHARAVDRLEQQTAALTAAQDRLQHDSAERFVALQRTVQQEWLTLRHLQLEPAGARHGHAADLTHACVAATTSRPLTPAPDALTDRERDLQDQLASVVSTTPQVGAVPQASPVEQSPAAIETPVLALPAQVPEAPPESTTHQQKISPEYLASEEVAVLRSDVSGRIAELHLLLRESEARVAELNEAHHRVNIRLTTTFVLLFLVAVGGGVWWMTTVQRQLAAAQARLADVEAQSARGAAIAAQQLTAAKAETDRMTASANRLSADTEIMGAVLAAPDLIRYGLSGANGSAASAQLLWSRSRGFVLSAARLAMPPAGNAYQVWLLTSGETISAGLLTPDAGGRATLVSDKPPRIRWPIAGVSITLEPAAGSPSPSDRIVAMNRVVRDAP